MIRFSATVTCQYDTIFSPFSAAEFDGALGWLEQSGFDGAELCISNYEGIDLGQIKSKLEAHRLGCSTISTGQARERENMALTHPDPQARARARKRVCEHIDAAAFLGSRVTVGLLRGTGQGGSREEQLELLAENLLPCLRYAQENGVTLLLEAINRYETTLLNSAQETAGFLNQLGNPEGLGILWDLFHANIEDPDFSAAVAAMGGRMLHVHLADSDRSFPGYGRLDFSALFRMFGAAQQQIWCSFECLNRPSVQAVRSGAGVFLQEMRAL